MNVLILCVGKLKERCWREACDEYRKRLSRFYSLSVYECADRPEPKNASPADVQRMLAMESASLLTQIKPRDHVVALCVDGEGRASDAFAQRMRALEETGVHRVVFVIGGSRGLSGVLLARADERISLSPMTFPHQIARVLLLEQLYRSKKMLAGETYHK